MAGRFPPTHASGGVLVQSRGLDLQCRGHSNLALVLLRDTED